MILKRPNVGIGLCLCGPFGFHKLRIQYALPKVQEFAFSVVQNPAVERPIFPYKKVWQALNFKAWKFHFSPFLKLSRRVNTSVSGAHQNHPTNTPSYCEKENCLGRLFQTWALSKLYVKLRVNSSRLNVLEVVQVHLNHHYPMKRCTGDIGHLKRACLKRMRNVVLKTSNFGNSRRNLLP